MDKELRLTETEWATLNRMNYDCERLDDSIALNQDAVNTRFIRPDDNCIRIHYTSLLDDKACENIRNIAYNAIINHLRAEKLDVCDKLATFKKKLTERQ